MTGLSRCYRGILDSRHGWSRWDGLPPPRKVRSKAKRALRRKLKMQGWE